MAEVLNEALVTAIDRYGSDVVHQALQSAALFRDLREHSQHALGVATEALTSGDVQGILVFAFSGIADEGPGITFLTGSAALVISDQDTETPVSVT